MQASQSNSCTSASCRGCFAEIAEIVASTKGLYWQQTKGAGDAHTVNVIWRMMGTMAVDLLTRKKSVIVPDFFHASIKVNKVTYYGRVVHHHKPQLVLLPDFTSKFHLQNVLVMKDAHYHATVPCVLGYSTLATHLGIDRFIVEAAMKDSIREIGKYLQRNPSSTLTIDVGVAFLEFRGSEYRVKWAPDFMKALEAAVGPECLVTPLDPPSMTKGGPMVACRFQRGCVTEGTLHRSIAQTADTAETRPSAAEIGDAHGHSAFSEESL